MLRARSPDDLPLRIRDESLVLGVVDNVQFLGAARLSGGLMEDGGGGCRVIIKVVVVVRRRPLIEGQGRLGDPVVIRADDTLSLVVDFDVPVGDARTALLESLAELAGNAASGQTVDLKCSEQGIGVCAWTGADGL